MFQTIVCAHTHLVHVRMSHATKYPPFVAQKGETILLLAALGGNVELVRMLLKECRSTLDEVNNVSVYTLACSKYSTTWRNMHFTNI